MFAAVTLTSGSVAVGVLGALVTAWVSVREYVLKSRAQRAETEIQLARLFSELVPIANGWGGSVVSEAAVTAISTAKPGFTGQDLGNAVVTVPVGAATQAAAIASIGHLGRTYEQLRRPAKAALDSLDFVEGHAQLETARSTALESLAD